MKKSLEELRATNRARQARWRAKHVWLARERVKEARGVSRAQTLGMPEVIGDGPAKEAVELAYCDMDEVEADARVMAIQRARSAQVRKELILPPESAPFDWDPRGEPELSAEEKRLLAQIERLKARPKGIKVEGFE